MYRLAVVGAGYVGLVTGACFAELGHHVVCVDNDERKIAVLLGGSVPFFEPQLAEITQRNLQAKRLSFTTDLHGAVGASDVIFIAVGTPMRSDGYADLSAVRGVARGIGFALNGPKLVVSKSTVPVETGELISAIIRENAVAEHAVRVVSNPEFLREGSAVEDFLHPTAWSSARTTLRPSASCATYTLPRRAARGY